MSLYPTIVRSGARLICKQCRHEHDVTTEWLTTVRAERFPKRAHNVLYEEDLLRLRCLSCGARSPRVVEPTVAPNLEPSDETRLGGWDIPFFPDWREQG